MTQAPQHMINWIKTGTNGDSQFHIAYRGPLTGPDLRLHYGFDGWQKPTHASVDGPHHYCRHPPNIAGQETYNEGLVPLIRALSPESSRQILGDNARRLFGLNGTFHS